MKKLSLLPLFLLVATLARATATAYSPPSGGVTSTAAASTDTLVSVTLAQPAAWVGTASSGSSTDIVVNGSPAWSANQFASGTYYYVRMLSGALAGHYFSIVANGAFDLTVDNAGLNLGTINNLDAMEIVPYWTLGTLYPASQAGVAFTTTTVPVLTKTQLLFFDATATGINRPASATYYFYNGAWRKVGQSSSTSFNNTIIYPDAYFLQRNSTSSTALVYMGRVQPSALGTVLVAATSQNDNFVALSYPIDVTLNQTGIAPSSFTTTTVPVLTKDQLLWFDPAGTGINRPASATYYYYNGAWRKVGASSSVDFGSTVLKAGSGFIIRKTANGTSASWVFSTGI
jgi:uncharacterized protein (TIGR02597 family)